MFQHFILLLTELTTKHWNLFREETFLSFERQGVVRLTTYMEAATTTKICMCEWRCYIESLCVYGTIALTENFLLTDLAVKCVLETERESACVCLCVCVRVRVRSVDSKQTRARCSYPAGIRRTLLLQLFFCFFATLVKTDLNKVWMRERACVSAGVHVR